MRDPWEATGLVLGVLEEIGESAKDATKDFFGDNEKSIEYISSPSESKSKLIKGTAEALESILNTLTGIFAEPFNTDDEANEILNPYQGESIEFMLKPISSKPNLVALTAKGTDNDPKTVYLDIDKIIVKKEQGYPIVHTFNLEKNNIKVHMDKELSLKIDEEALRKQINEVFRKPLNEFAIENCEENCNVLPTERAPIIIENEINKIQKMQLKYLRKRESNHKKEN